MKMKYALNWFRIDDLLLAEIIKVDQEDLEGPLRVQTDYFDTFDKAREAYSNYLKAMIEDYEIELNRFKDVETYLQYEEQIW
jgi:hypothetical protein